MGPNFCVNLKLDKFHTVAHFRKVLLSFGKCSVDPKEGKKIPLYFPIAK
jgi:hypothetical protein